MGHTFVAEDAAAEIVGWSSSGPSRDEAAACSEGELHGLYVDAANHGTGAGLHLLNAAVQALFDEGSVTVSLYVLAGNKRARAFYEKCGFQLVGEQAGGKYDVAEV